MNDYDGVNLPQDQNSLSLAHRRLIKGKMTTWGWGAVGVVGLAIAAIVFIAMKLTNPALATRGEWIPMVLIGGLWLWWLRQSIPQWLRARQDLATGNLETIQGTIRYEIGNGVGLIPIMKYGLWVDNMRFEVTQQQLFALQSGHAYQVWYAPCSHVFLAATLLNHELNAIPIGAASIAPLPVPMLPEGIQPINEREQAILRLIAQGLANKEIAQQLSLSINTVKMYTSQLYQKMGVKRRTEAVQRAREWGLLP